jgi:hypothetical protein
MKNALKRAHYLPGLTWRPAEQTTASGGEAEAFRLSVPRFRFDPPKRWESVGTSYVWPFSSCTPAEMAHADPNRCPQDLASDRHES